MATSRPAYCSLGDVTSRIYSGQNTPSVAVNDPGRDTLLTSLIQAVSRRFDSETGRPPGCYAPQFDVRLYSGRGAMNLDTDEFGYLSKVEYNATPGMTPSWQDVTGDFGTYRMATLPPRTWPKSRVFRQQTFLVDPYRTGNIRLTGVFGCIEPDWLATPPTGQVPAWQGLTDAQITALQPVNPATGAAAGWWITPERVLLACAMWVVYQWKAQQAAYSDTSGTGEGGGNIVYRKGIPPEVQMIIDSYTRARPHVASITVDGQDVADEGVYNAAYGPDSVSRWAGWMTRPGP